MCTVVCRWMPQDAYPVQMLALRDERASRSFDLPGEWWPEQPGVVGGRDRQAGGSWCVSAVASGVTAVVLNRPEQPVAVPGAPSRGVLPLLAVQYGAQWPRHLELSGMASFNLVLAGPGQLTWWSFDGTALVREELAAGSYMFTTRGRPGTGVDTRFTSAEPALVADGDGAAQQAWPRWMAVVLESRPSDDPRALLVHHPVTEEEAPAPDVFETVFGQFIAGAPGRLRLDYTLRPAEHGPWTSRRWGAKAGTQPA